MLKQLINRIATTSIVALHGCHRSISRGIAINHRLKAIFCLLTSFLMLQAQESLQAGDDYSLILDNYAIQAAGDSFKVQDKDGQTILNEIVSFWGNDQYLWGWCYNPRTGFEERFVFDLKQGERVPCEVGVNIPELVANNSKAIPQLFNTPKLRNNQNILEFCRINCYDLEGEFNVDDPLALKKISNNRELKEVLATLKDKSGPDLTSAIAEVVKDKFPNWSKQQKLEFLSREMLQSSEATHQELFELAKAQDLLIPWVTHAVGYYPEQYFKLLSELQSTNFREAEKDKSNWEKMTRTDHKRQFMTFIFTNKITGERQTLSYRLSKDQKLVSDQETSDGWCWELSDGTMLEFILDINGYWHSKSNKVSKNYSLTFVNSETTPQMIELTLPLPQETDYFLYFDGYGNNEELKSTCWQRRRVNRNIERNNTQLKLMLQASEYDYYYRAIFDVGIGSSNRSKNEAPMTSFCIDTTPTPWGERGNKRYYFKYTTVPGQKVDPDMTKLLPGEIGRGYSYTSETFRPEDYREDQAIKMDLPYRK